MNLKLLFTSAVVAGLLAVSSNAAFANSLTISIVSGYQSGSGGEFNIKSSDPGLSNPAALGYNAKAIVNGGFETFCLEYGEQFTPGNTYNYSISGGAKAGGPGATNGIDMVSMGTAWLYQQFATGVLAGYDYTPGAGRQASAAMLQNTIWWLENENYSNGTSPNPNNVFSNMVMTHFATQVAAMADNTAFKVSALNLGAAPGYSNQDQLVLSVPDSGTTLGLLSIVVAAAALAHRRMVTQ